MMRVIFFVFAILFVTPAEYAFGFNSKKCSRMMVGGKGEGLILSTTSFVSSTGDCSLFASRLEERRFYYSANFEKLAIDFAKGGGEFSTSFAKLYGCNSYGKALYPQVMKSHFTELFGSSKLLDKDDSFLNIENLVISNSALSLNCSVEDFALL